AEREQILSLGTTPPAPGDCPGTWERLAPTGEADARQCPVCQLRVEYRYQEALPFIAFTNGDFYHSPHVLDPRCEGTLTAAPAVDRGERGPPAVPAGESQGVTRPAGWVRRVIRRLVGR